MSLKISSKIIGYDDDFSNFLNLYKLKKMPNSILLLGLEGIGKYTFSLHLIATILHEDNEKIESKLVKNHNVLILKKAENIKEYTVDEIRNVINFCKFRSDVNIPKFILIRNINDLNNNSVNALLKLTEEPNNNVYFIFTANILQNYSETLSSRFYKKKMFLSKNFYLKIINNYIKENSITVSKITNELKETPGDYIRKYIVSVNEQLVELKKNNESLFFKIMSENIINRNNFDYLTDLKKMRISLYLKNDINRLILKYNK